MGRAAGGHRVELGPVAWWRKVGDGARVSNLAGLTLVSVGLHAGGFSGCGAFLEAAAAVAVLFAGSTAMVIALIGRGARQRREAAAILAEVIAPPRLVGLGLGVGVGVGAMLRADGDGLHVDSVVPGGGAEAAGDVPGDVSVAEDDAYVGSLGVDGSIRNLRGPEGSTVRLTVRRAGQVGELTATRIRV